GDVPDSNPSNNVGDIVGLFTDSGRVPTDLLPVSRAQGAIAAPTVTAAGNEVDIFHITLSQPGLFKATLRPVMVGGLVGELRLFGPSGEQLLVSEGDGAGAFASIGQHLDRSPLGPSGQLQPYQLEVSSAVARGFGAYSLATDFESSVLPF